MKYFIIISLFLCACGSIPEPLNEETRSPPHFRDSVSMILDYWNARLPEVPQNPPLIRWFKSLGDKTCLYYDDDLDAACLFGVYYFLQGPDEEEIQVIQTLNVSESALAHELLHFALQHSDGYGDEYHENSLWDEVDGLNQQLYGAGY